MNSGEIDVIADENEVAGGEIGADGARSIGYDERPDAESGEYLGGVDDLPGSVSLVGMDATLHDGERRAGEGAEDEAASVSFDGGPGEVRNLGIGDGDLVGEPIGKATEASAEDDRDLRSQRGAFANGGCCAFGLVEC
jgi:hypothetical protein